MSFFSAVGKCFARSANNALYNHDKKSAGKKAYAQTGKEIQKAKKSGNYFNASKRYKQNYSSNLNKASQRKELRNQFISDL